MNKPYVFKGLLTAYESVRDVNGNVYDAFEYIDFKSGAIITGKDCGGVSNIQAMQGLMNIGRKGKIIFRITTLPKKMFTTLVENFPFMGTNAENTVKYIIHILKKEHNTKF